MKILYFYQYFGTREGAFSTRVYEFGRRWAAQGDQVTVVTSVYDKSDLRPSSGLTARFDVEGIDVRVINIRLSNKHEFFHRIVTFLLYALISSWYALTVRADVVVASSGPITVGIPALVARYLRGRPLVMEVRDLWPEGAIQLGVLRNPLLIRAARGLERLCYASSRRVVALSQGMADWIRERYGFDHIAIVPNASDIELFGGRGSPDVLPAWGRDKHLVIYAGAIGFMNDCGQILDAAAFLQRRNVEDVLFLLIGDGKERAPLEEKAHAEGLQNVRFLGLIPKTEVAPWLRTARGALCTFRNVPILDTSSPNKLFDALAAGTPVVQTTRGWIARLIEEHECGLNVPPADSEALARAVLHLVGDDDAWQRMSRNAQEVARTYFDRDRLAQAMRSVLEEAARGENAPQG